MWVWGSCVPSSIKVMELSLSRIVFLMWYLAVGFMSLVPCYITSTHTLSHVFSCLLQVEQRLLDSSSISIFKNGGYFLIESNRNLDCIVHWQYLYNNFHIFATPPQPFQPITECVNPTPTTRGAITLAFIAHASRTTRPTCSAAITTTLRSNTAATRPSSRRSCSSTSPPPQMDMLTSELKPVRTAVWPHSIPYTLHLPPSKGWFKKKIKCI